MGWGEVYNGLDINLVYMARVRYPLVGYVAAWYRYWKLGQDFVT